MSKEQGKINSVQLQNGGSFFYPAVHCVTHHVNSLLLFT
jgi:hypothetical protein